MRDRIFGILILALIATVVAVAIISLVANLRESGGSTSTSLPPLIAPGSLKGAAAKEFDRIAVTPILTLQLERLDPSAQQLTGNLIMSYPSGAESFLFDSATKEPIFVCDKNNNCTLKPKFADRTVNLDVLVANSKQFDVWEFKKSIPFKSIFENSIFGKDQSKIEIPVAGNPDLYPQDRYFFDITLSFDTPGVTRLINGKEPPAEFADSYAVDPGTVAKTSEVKVSDIVAGGQTFHDSFHILVSRSALTQVYSYVVALIPLIAVLVFLHLLFFSRNPENRRFEEAPEALLIVVLAVLPLRIVVVPAEITSLTRIDVLLAIELALILGVAFGRYALSLLEGPRAPDAVELGDAPAHVATPAE